MSKQYICGNGEIITIPDDHQEVRVPSPTESQVRDLGPNDFYTMDYRPNRLNRELDENGNVVRTWMG